MKPLYTLLYISIAAFIVASCGGNTGSSTMQESVMLIDRVGYPQAILHDGHYYFTMQSIGGDSVELFCTDDLQQLSKA